jgi:uncharacterized protein YndB with AHSA1/START domain
MLTPFHHIPRGFEYFQNQALQHATFIHANPMQVYLTLTTPLGLDAWFTGSASAQAVKNGQIHFRWVNWGPDRISTEDGRPVLQAIPGERFIIQLQPESTDYITTVGINLAFKDGGTIVSLCEHGFAASPSGLQAMVDCAAGWGDALALLNFYLEYGLHY